MEQCYLMPGQERCEKIKDANGVPKVSYSYRSLQGAFFHCVSTGGSGSLFVCGRKTAIQTKKKSENLAKLWAIVPGENNIRWGELTTFLIPGIIKHDIVKICQNLKNNAGKRFQHHRKGASGNGRTVYAVH